MTNQLANISVGTLPPVNAAQNTLWLSTAKEDLRIPHSPNEHKVALAPGVGQGTQQGTSFTWESTGVQEARVFWNTALLRFEMYYSSTSSGIGHAWSNTVDGPWTRTSTTTVPNLAAGYHHRIYIEGSTIYITYSTSGDTTHWRLATAQLSAPQTIAAPGTIIYSTALSNGIQCGSAQITKINGIYYLFAEHAYGLYSWQTGIATCATVNGTYAMLTPILGELQPSFTGGLGNSMVGGPQVFYEDGAFKMFYHAGNRYVAPSTDIFSAVSYDLANWTVQNQGNPIIRRCHPLEVDQVADMTVVDYPNSGSHAFWSGNSNQGAVFYVMHGDMSPTLKMFSGVDWQTALPAFDPVNQLQLKRTALNISAYTAFNLDDVMMNPGSTANMAVTLPRASAGARCRITCTGNASGVATGSALPTAASGDTMLSGAVALTIGQSANFECFLQGYWIKV